jgi:hypothetical protein
MKELEKYRYNRRLHTVNVHDVIVLHAHIQSRQQAVDDHFEVLLPDGGKSYEVNVLIRAHLWRVVVSADDRNLVPSLSQPYGELFDHLLDAAIGGRDSSASEHDNPH